MKVVLKMARSSVMALVLSAVMSSCAADVAQDADEIAVATEPLSNGWSPETSDGWPPIECAGHVGGVGCTGSYCDNVSALCRDPIGSRGASTWSDYFSEEGSNVAIPAYQIPAGGLRPPLNGAFCPDGAYVSGFSCTGRYCDNLSINCTTFRSIAVTNSTCHWSPRLSEENSAMVFPENEVMLGVACFGKYCDDKKFYMCRMR